MTWESTSHKVCLREKVTRVLFQQAPTGRFLAALAYRFSGSDAVVSQMLATITCLVQAPAATPGCEDSPL
jgi:hypothetical protein